MFSGCSRLISPSQTDTPLLDNLSSRNDLIWNLVWSDEFEYEGLPDPSKWDYEIGYVRNNEIQYYTEKRLENVKVENGLLIIETKHEPYKDFDYTSASLHTKSKENWLYGRIEVRAKIPTGRGIWSTIWMLGSTIDDAGWPACGEIDIMENVGFDPNRIYLVIHTQDYNWMLKNQKGASVIISNPYQEFHVYAIEWFENRIDFFVDDEKHFTFKKEDEGIRKWPFDHKQYLLINTAVGGTLGGMHGIDNSIFPQKFYIDYVRVYKFSVSF